MLPVELLKGDETTNIETLSKFSESTKEARRNARVEMEKIVVIQQCYYNKEHWDIQFSIRDLVLLSTQNLRLKGIPNKLQQQFCGP